jgi:hypothetical protein
MSLLNINITDINLIEKFPEYVKYDEKLKDKYGEVNTPYTFISGMLSTIPPNWAENKNCKWLDAGAGKGNFSFCLFVILFKSLVNIIPDDNERKNHIINNMIYMIELNEDNIIHLREKFGENANIYHEDYIKWNTDLKFDFIIGNPPYNSDGIKKVPTNTMINKKEDGKTIWPDFIRKNISLLKENGMMVVVIPSIWLKPDKAGIYDLLLKYEIEKMTALNASAVMRIFNNQVQTPLCYFLLTKRENQGKIELYDQVKKDYIEFKLRENIPIPLCFASIVNKFLKVVDKYSPIDVIKTNTPKKGTLLNDIFSLTFPFRNVHTTIIDKKTKRPELQFKYSSDPLSYQDKPKIIMAHKMYGFPYVDTEGLYGISARDNYIIKRNSVYELELIKEFLSTHLILFLFETTRYRMRYLEKYVFEYIPDFSKIPEAIEMFDNKINNNINIDIYKLFDISIEEKEYIEGYNKNKYKFF